MSQSCQHACDAGRRTPRSAPHARLIALAAAWSAGLRRWRRWRANR